MQRTSVYAGAGGSDLELNQSVFFANGRHKSENRMFLSMTGLAHKFRLVRLSNPVRKRIFC
jgi:hypothetical protein